LNFSLPLVKPLQKLPHGRIRETRTLKLETHSVDYIYVGPKKRSVRVVVFPGNPGTAGWYEHFLLELENLTKRKDVGFYCISHAGHDTSGLNGLRTFDVEEQVQSAMKAMERIEPAEHTVFVGHSFGAHVCQEIVKRNGEIKPSSCLVYLMPLTYCKRRVNDVEKFLMRKALSDPVAAVVAAVTSVIPSRLRRALVRSKGYSEAAVSQTLQCAGKFGLFRNILHLVRSEVQTVEGLDFELLRQMQDRHLYYHVDDDRWDPEDAYNFYCKTLGPGASVHDRSGTKHAFVLQDDWVSRVARKVSGFIDEM